ncbi:MAG: Dyp-type peroxidase [Chloroflexota bacterium]
MRTHQSGIFALGTASHSYLEFDLHQGAVPSDMARIVADLRGPKATTGGVNLVVGFRPALWQTIAPDDMPAHVIGFDQDLVGIDGYTMPSTQHDLFLWVAGHIYEKVFDTAREAIRDLAHVAKLVDETPGWTYKDNRDLTGFIDGTENPSLDEAPRVALIPHGEPGAGGSIVLVQKWVQHTDAWDALAVEEQERVMGRTKADSVELPDNVRDAAAHVSRTVVEENGEDLAIFRRNTPFGGVVEHGTMFIGFSADQHTLIRMLERMAGAEDGVRDALTFDTTAVSGSYYFVPAIEALASRGTPETG